MAKRATTKLQFAVLATDGAIFMLRDGILHLLLIKVTIPEFAGRWGLPGGLIKPDEVADTAVRRHLGDKAHVRGAYLEQLYTFSDVDRDPRGRVVSVAYLGLVRPDQVQPLDTGETRWCPIQKLPKLAYDHNKITATAIERLRGRVGYTNIIQFLLPREFTLSELQQAYETVLGHVLDKRNFRKKVVELALIKETGRQKRGEAHRPADLYQFTSTDVETVEVV